MQSCHLNITRSIHNWCQNTSVLRLRSSAISWKVCYNSMRLLTIWLSDKYSIRNATTPPAAVATGKSRVTITLDKTVHSRRQRAMNDGRSVSYFTFAYFEMTSCSNV
jgi:hypothetical protein